MSAPVHVKLCDICGRQHGRAALSCNDDRFRLAVLAEASAVVVQRLDWWRARCDLDGATPDVHNMARRAEAATILDLLRVLETEQTGGSIPADQDSCTLNYGHGGPCESHGRPESNKSGGPDVEGG